MYSKPSFTGMLSACVAWSRAGSRRRLRIRGLESSNVEAICRGSLVINALQGPRSSWRRVYANPSNAVDVKGIGPLGFRGSRLDSGASCHVDVQRRKAFLSSQLFSI